MVSPLVAVVAVPEGVHRRRVRPPDIRRSVHELGTLRTAPDRTGAVVEMYGLSLLQLHSRNLSFDCKPRLLVSRGLDVEAVVFER